MSDALHRVEKSASAAGPFSDGLTKVLNDVPKTDDGCPVRIRKGYAYWTYNNVRYSSHVVPTEGQRYVGGWVYKNGRMRRGRAVTFNAGTRTSTGTNRPVGSTRQGGRPVYYPRDWTRGHWTWPGDLRQHLIRTHGMSPSRINALTPQQLMNLHDSLHTGRRVSLQRSQRACPT